MLTTTVSVRIPVDLVARVRAQAQVEDRSFSAVVRRALTANLVEPVTDATEFEGR